MQPSRGPDRTTSAACSLLPPAARPKTAIAERLNSSNEKLISSDGGVVTVSVGLNFEPPSLDIRPTLLGYSLERHGTGTLRPGMRKGESGDGVFSCCYEGFRLLACILASGAVGRGMIPEKKLNNVDSEEAALDDNSSHHTRAEFEGAKGRFSFHYHHYR